MVVMMFMLLLATPVPVYAVAVPVTPVFDFNSLINSIKEFASTVQYYQQMTQQIKREYEKMKRAAEKIKTGKFGDFLQVCMSIANQAAGCGITGDYADQVLGDMSNLFGNTLTLSSAYEKIHANFKQSGDAWTNAVNSIGSGKEWDSWFTGSLDLLSSSGDIVLDATDWAERFTGDMQAALNPITDLVFVVEGVNHDKETYQLAKLEEQLKNLREQEADLKRQRQESIGEQETGKQASFDNMIEDVQSAIKITEDEIEKLRNDIQNTKDDILGDTARGKFVDMVNQTLNGVEDWQMEQLRTASRIYRQGMLKTLVNVVTPLPKDYSFNTDQLKVTSDLANEVLDGELLYYGHDFERKKDENDKISYTITERTGK